MIQKQAKALGVGGVLLGTVFCTGCTRDQVLRLTYETLRQEDCHRTNINTDYCDRSYAFDYARYKKLRSTYLQEMSHRRDRDLALNDDVAFILPTREN